MNIVFMSMDTLPSTLWARDLYDQMHIRSDFRKWFPRMCQYGFIEGRDYEYMPRVRLQDEGGRTVQRYVKDYRITQDMAKKLCKLHHTAVGAAYHPQPFDWDALLGLLHKKPPRRSSYEAQLSDSDSLVTATQIAKEYGCGAKVFNRLLHLHGIQYLANGQWVLYSEHHGKGKKVTPDTKVGVMRQMIVENEQADKDSTQIIALFDRIMKQEQDDPQIPMLYAQYLLSKNMESESVPVLEQVVDLDPTNKAARMMLIGAAVKKEDYKQIIKVCEPGIEATPDALEFYYYLAVAYNQAEKPDSVISICKRALEHTTADSKKEIVSDFYSILGDMYHTQKQMKEAYAAYDSALVYNPSNIGALNNYAYYLSVERRDLDKAEEMSYKTVKAEPNNATYLDTYAWILFEKGNYAEARIYIDNAMKSEGGDKSDVIVEHCGDIYYMTGDVDGALTYWKKALEMGSESKTLKQKIEKKKYIAE